MRLRCRKCSNIFDAGNGTPGTPVPCPQCGTAAERPDRVGPGVVLGDFLIEKSITSGGMGEIFVARQLSLDREVALKVLQKKYSSDPEFAESLLHEARAAAKLNHPNIVQAYAVGQEDGIFYFAMEYIRGETYKQILRRKKRLDALEASQVVLDVARALDAAWGQQKLVHQDIKPENIMHDASGFSKLADLGLARRAGSEKEEDGDTDEVMGTPQYISPEQLTGVPTDVRSDIYSLGATFYHFVTGRFPYVAPTTEEMVQMHVDGHLQPPIEVCNRLPAEINRIIVKMMARDPADRYQTPAELIADLENFIRGEAGESTRNVKVRRPWSRKKKCAVAAGAVSVCILLAAALFAAGVIGDGRESTPDFARPFCRYCAEFFRRAAAAVSGWKRTITAP
ncbi:MAG: serine/threonine protein kinase, partial [Victivallaceae bacterium]|nr:serine/threonine protein kinase [Victivallaceae bacterium]